MAEPGAGQGMTQAARDALRKVDTVPSENSGALKDTIANFNMVSEGLARNSGKLDGTVAGLERMTGATSWPPKITYDQRALQNPDPGFAEATGADVLPKLIQARLIERFENTTLRMRRCALQTLGRPNSSCWSAAASGFVPSLQPRFRGARSSEQRTL